MLESHFATVLQAVQKPFSRPFLPAFELEEVIFPKVIQVGRSSCQIKAVQLLDRRFSCENVHSLAPEEMQHLALDLGRASVNVRAEILRLSFFLDQRSAAIRTNLREFRGAGGLRTP